MITNDYVYFYPDSDISIKDVQKVELEIVYEFNRICRKHNLPYQIFGGTLLGAVRHNGFIPWDDDVDIAMKREDFIKFINICKEELDNRFFLQTCFTDPTSIIQFAKIRKNGTIYENDVDNLPTSNTGIWIDIFPLDNVCNNFFLASLQRLQIQFYYAITTSSVKNRVILCPNPIKRIVRRFFSFVVKVISKKTVDCKLDRIFNKYNCTKTENITHLTMGGTKKVYYSYMQKTKDFYNLREFEFEGLSLLGPVNYDEVLTNIYGDYMKLPPIEKRNPDHGITKVKV